MLPNGDRAILDLRKLADYCLNPAHPRGRHKARVFRDSLDMGRADASDLRARLPYAAANEAATPLPGDAWGDRWQIDVMVSRQGRRAVLRTVWIVRSGDEIRDLLGLVMTAIIEQGDSSRDFLSAVALLRDLPQHGLARGQVGTVVDALDETTALVEFSDDSGAAYAIVACPRDALLVLRTAPLAA